MNQLHLALRAIAGRLLPIPAPPLRRFRSLKIAAAGAAVLYLTGNASALTSVALAWNPNPESDLAGYKVHYGTASGQYPQVVDVGAATSKTLAALADGTTYYFAVSAYNRAGIGSSISAEISYATPAAVATNTAPSAGGKNVTTAEDISLPVTLSGSDPDGDSLTYVIASGPANGTLSGIPPNINYAPKLNYNGADSFTFHVNDGTANSPVATVVINISPANDSPVAFAQTVTTPEDMQKTLVLGGSDVDGNSLVFSIVAGPARGTLTGSPPNVIYQPAGNYNGPDEFTFSAGDGSAMSTPATIKLNVTAVNDPPLAIAGAIDMLEDTAKSILLGGIDIDGNTMSFSIVTAPAHGTLSGNPPDLTYLPSRDYSGPDEFTFRVNDGAADSPAASMKISVAEVAEPNHIPEAVAANLTLAEDTPATFTLQGTDADGDPLTFIIVSSPANGTLTGAFPTLTYLPAKNFTGTDHLAFKVTDGKDHSATTTITFTVTRQNDRPGAKPMKAYTTKNKPLNLILQGSDDDGDPLKYRILKFPSKGVLKGVPPNVTYIPKKNFKGTDQFIYRVNDGSLDSKLAVVTILVGTTIPNIAIKATAIARPAKMPELAIRPGRFATGRDLSIMLKGEAGRTYEVECSMDLQIWRSLREITMDASGAGNFQVPVAEDRSRYYYRLRLP